MRAVPEEISRESKPGTFERVRDFVAASIDSAPASDEPFHHLVLGPVFPPDVYDAMQSAMPVASSSAEPASVPAPSVCTTPRAQTATVARCSLRHSFAPIRLRA